MRRLLVTILAAVGMPLPVLSAPPSAADLEADWGEVLRAGVRGDRVDYAALVARRDGLDALGARLAEAEPGTGDDERAAFWVNAYNFLVVRAVVAEYPVESPRAIGGFFDRDRHLVAGRRLTLDVIEQREILGRFRDPRLHFALVCAARSCPPLLAEPYTAASLDAQLEARARAVVNDEAFVRVDGGVLTLSRIFDWYRSDFGRDGSLVEWLNRYRETPLPTVGKIEFDEYDWTLNDTATLESAAGAGRRLRYTPSALLLPRELEIRLFNNVYTQTAFYDGNGDEQDQGGRSSYLTSELSLRRGWRRRAGLGLDVTLKAVRDERFADDFRAAVTSVTPIVQLQPFSTVPGMSLETGFLVPVGTGLEGSSELPFLDFGDPVWLNELFWDVPLSRRFLLFLRAGAFFRFDSDSAQLTTPLTAILNAYPARRWTLYALGEIGPRWLGDVSGSYFAQVGLGTKFLMRPWFEIELLATTFPAGESAGAGHTGNLGLRFLR